MKGRLCAITLFATILANGQAYSKTAEEAGPVDPLQPVAAMLEKSVVITRGDAGVEDEDINAHIAVTREALAQALSQAITERPAAYEDDIHLYSDMGEMLSLIEMAKSFLENDDKHSAHHAFKGIRLMLSDIRARNGVIAVGDYVWRYNCAFHPMMHEVMHQPKGQSLSAEQLGVCKKTVVNADMALSALRSVVERIDSEKKEKRLALVAACQKTLDQLSEALENDKVEAVVPNVKALRQRFIKLASFEASVN